MEPYTYSDHEDGIDLDTALEIIGAGWNEPTKDRIEAILSILTKAEQEAAWDKFLSNLIDDHEREIYAEAHDRV